MDTAANNKQYISGLDVLRLIASIGVIFSHSFMEYHNFFDAYIVRICVRWIVPFFFLVTGYFLKDDTKAFVKYIIHILIQYIFWTLLYAIIFDYDIYSVKNFLSALRSGLIMPFWYYPTLLICVTFVWLLFKFVKNQKIILIICSVLFIYAIIGHTLINFPAFDFINNGYLMRFHHRIIGETTTRDGIFWGSLYIAIGRVMRLNKDSELFKIKNTRKFWLIFIPLFILTSLEEWAVVYFNTGEKDILIGTIPVAIMLFTYAQNKQLDKKVGGFLRTTSNAVYLTHYFFLAIFMQHNFLSAPLFFLTLACTLLTSMLLAFLSERIKLMKYIV